MGDRQPELLRSAIENVLRNAVRYSPAGAQVEVAVESGESGLAVSIRDAGRACRKPIWSAYSSRFSAWRSHAIAIPAARASASPSPHR